MHQGGSAAAAGSGDGVASRSTVQNGQLTLFLPATNGPKGPVARIVTVGEGKQKTIWHCPREIWCGQSVSFAWAPDGRRLAFTLDEIGGASTYVGMHVVNLVTGQDTRVPPGAPTTTSANGWSPYLQKMLDRVGCWPATELAWSTRRLEPCLPLRSTGKQSRRRNREASYQHPQAERVGIHDASHRHPRLLALVVSFWNTDRLCDLAHPSDSAEPDLHDRARWVAPTTRRGRRHRTRLVSRWANDRLPDTVRDTPRHASGGGCHAADRAERLRSERSVGSPRMVSGRTEARDRDDERRLRHERGR